MGMAGLRKLDSGAESENEVAQMGNRMGYWHHLNIYQHEPSGLYSAEITARVRPWRGAFIHLRIPRQRSRALRRGFEQSDDA